MRGGGRVRFRGRGGRGSRGVSGRSKRSLDFVTVSEQNPTPETSTAQNPTPETSTAQQKQTNPSLDEELKLIKAAKARDKKNLAKLSPKTKEMLLQKREQKQVARFLMPDAPKKATATRKHSPTRIECPLVPGTPSTPPARVPQKWEKDPEPGPSGIATNPIRPIEKTPTSKKRKITFSPSVGIPSEQGELDKPLVENVPKKATATREHSPTRVECPLVPGTPSTPPARVPQKWEKDPEPGPSGIATNPIRPIEKTPTSKKRKIIFSPSVGILTEQGELDKPLVDNVEIELIGFSPSSTSSWAPSRQEYKNEPIDDGEVANWETDLADENPAPGSDMEEDGSDTECVELRRRNVNEFPSNFEEVPLEIAEQCQIMDAEDDAALHNLASNLKDGLNFEWSSDPSHFKGKREEFTGPSGPTFDGQGLTPVEIFEKIWTPDFMEQIVKETNLYAHQLQSGGLKKFSRMHMWKDINVSDLWVFLAVIMQQSVINITVESEYWYPRLEYLKVGQFHEMMPYKKFVLLKKCLHFVDNTESVANDKLHKVMPVINHLNEKFSTLYLPEQNIAIDESLLLWKGKLSFAQLIANKAAKVGIKTYELCESRTGYLWKLEVYAGKKQTNKLPASTDDREADEPQNATSQIVYRLARPLFNKGHTLVMDNFYNSPLLTRSLKAQKTDTMGTLRLNREFVPDSLKHKSKSSMRAGEVCFSQTEDLSIVVWKDSNIVSLISSFHPVQVAGKEKYGYFKYKPQVVLDYNLSMGGVDKKDQLLHAFPVERVRNIVWYKKLFRRLVNVSIHNAYVIYKHYNQMADNRSFRLALLDGILKKYHPNAPKALKYFPPIPPGEGHFPIRNASNRSRCKFCSMNKQKSRTSWMCDTCQVNLCIEPCFKKYHTGK